MALIDTIEVSVKNAHEVDAVTLIVQNIQDVRIMDVLTKKFMVQITMVSGRIYYYVDSSGDYEFDSYALAETARDGFVNSLIATP